MGPAGPQGEQGPQGPPGASPWSLDSFFNVFYTAGKVLVGTSVPVADETMTIAGSSPTVLGVNATDPAGVAIAAAAASPSATAIQATGNIRIAGAAGVTGLIFADGTIQTTAASGGGGTPGGGNAASTVVGTGSINVTSSMTSFTVIPGLSQTLNVPANSVVLICADGGVQTSSQGSASGVSRVDIALFIDGVQHVGGAYKRVTAANTGGVQSNNIANWEFTVATTLPAGSHTFHVGVAFNGGVTAVVSGGNGSVLQSALTVVILKQ